MYELSEKIRWHDSAESEELIKPDGPKYTNKYSP